MTAGFQQFIPRDVETPVAEPPVDQTTRPANSWQLPEMRGGASNRSRPAPATDAPAELADEVVDELATLREQARQEGFAKGEAEARTLLAEQSQQLQLAMAALREAQAWLEGEVQQELILLAQELAQALIVKEIDADPEIVTLAVERAVAMLPSAEGHIQLQLHPADAQLLRDHAAVAEPLAAAWDISEDADIRRGGCVIKSRTSQVDQRTDKRLQALLEQVLVDESGQN